MSELLGLVSHHDSEVRELRTDRQLAINYLKVAVESLHRRDERIAAVAMLATLSEAYGDLTSLALQSGVSMDGLFMRVIQAKIPTFDTYLHATEWFDKAILQSPAPVASRNKLA